MLQFMRRMHADLISSFHRDPRTNHLPLVGSPMPMICILVVYFLFVKKWGPALMAKRKAMDLKLPMQIYNVIQVFLNIYVVIATTWYTYAQPEFRFFCQPYNIHDTSPHIMKLRYSAYVYYITKYMDLLDTVFFVLRKKDRQISFLHVYHHSGMVYVMWVYMTLLFGSHYAMFGIINSFIHVLMYSYYFMAACKPSFDLNPWKRALTTIQIVQFGCNCLHLVYPILYNTCQLDMFWVWVGFTQNLFLIVLFSNFYIRTYIKKPTPMLASATSGSFQKNE